MNVPFRHSSGHFGWGAGPGQTNLDEETELDNGCKKCGGQRALIMEVWGTCPPLTPRLLHPWYSVAPGVSGAWVVLLFCEVVNPTSEYVFAIAVLQYVSQQSMSAKSLFA